MLLLSIACFCLGPLLLGVTLWSQAGSILKGAGEELLSCEECPCGGASGEPCEKCDEGTAPSILRVTFTGVANDGCESCAGWNDTEFELVQRAENSCVWFLEAGLPCGAVLLEASLENFGGPDLDTRVLVVIDDSSDVFFEGALFDEVKESSDDGGLNCGAIGEVAFFDQTNAQCDWTAATCTLS